MFSNVADRELENQCAHLAQRRTSLDLYKSKYDDSSVAPHPHPQYDQEMEVAMQSVVATRPDLNHTDVHDYLHSIHDAVVRTRAKDTDEKVIQKLIKALNVNAGASGGSPASVPSVVKPKKGKGKASQKSVVSKSLPKPAEGKKWTEEEAGQMEGDLDSLLDEVVETMKCNQIKRAEEIARLETEVRATASSIPSSMQGDIYAKGMEHALSGLIHVNGVGNTQSTHFHGCHFVIQDVDGSKYSVKVVERAKLRQQPLGDPNIQGTFTVLLHTITDPAISSGITLEGMPVEGRFISGSYGRDKANLDQTITDKFSTTFMVDSVLSVRKLLLFIEGALAKPTPEEIQRASAMNLVLRQCVAPGIVVEARWHNERGSWRLSTFFPVLSPGTAVQQTREVVVP